MTSTGGWRFGVQTGVPPGIQSHPCGFSPAPGSDPQRSCVGHETCRPAPSWATRLSIDTQEFLDRNKPGLACDMLEAYTGQRRALRVLVLPSGGRDQNGVVEKAVLYERSAHNSRAILFLAFFCSLGACYSVLSSSAVSVCSPTSHFLRIMKIVFERKPARVSSRKIRAACFCSCGFWTRLRCR